MQRQQQPYSVYPTNSKATYRVWEGGIERLLPETPGSKKHKMKLQPVDVYKCQKIRDRTNKDAVNRGLCLWGLTRPKGQTVWHLSSSTNLEKDHISLRLHFKHNHFVNYLIFSKRSLIH
ncbi:hypothetical protein HanRHA438_Chr12g0567701 [Helianthus annuus]|uniref:Uncharacterized protein n=1 Tax=Helianthus annuus TaxID=4232 RepID=A0A9K3MXB8_HELAN|nr:hypothetical protein HanXRQr2_Chr12g0556341 [Helianthus annuus]KAJ0490485.1 hypothetical protein HanHA300_Chr12g0455991 [Helianthus annuus]KAJ0494701.1 hypothetical protein HanIR_Chr12g0600441 [Helianthus annuus]KAJ0506402.1 hypothetical protein HanHA89_Chr12g0481551 [Helianthus annuus]KAJ0676078.1 hypothetical protein HanLR1_Chr12g0458521 [Helianthus annuus]